MIPVGVRAELQRAPLGAPCCRWAELAAMLALRGRLQMMAVGAGMVVELSTAAAAERLCRLLHGPTPDARVLLVAPAATPLAAAGAAAPGTDAVTPTWTVLVRPGAPLARQAAMLNRHGQQLLGLPGQVLRGGECCAAAVWRAALLATPAPGGRQRADGLPGLAVDCPNPVIAVALIGLARRLGARAQVQTCHGIDHAHLATPGDITRLLTATGGPTAAVTAFPAVARRAPRQAAMSGTFSAVNDRKAQRAGAHAADQITAAFALLGENHPALTAELRAAGQLRLDHPDLSLIALAQLAEPPLTKDTLHGRIRRLLAIAARHRAPNATPPGSHNAQRTG